MTLDYQTDYVNLRMKESHPSRKATQADFDNF